jgi:hypothetical protein
MVESFLDKGTIGTPAYFARPSGARQSAVEQFPTSPGDGRARVWRISWRNALRQACRFLLILRR